MESSDLKSFRKSELPAMGNYEAHSPKFASIRVDPIWPLGLNRTEASYIPLIANALFRAKIYER